MNWLTLATGAVMALDEDQRVLETIAQLARLLDQNDQGIAGERELPDLLLRLGGDATAIRAPLISALAPVAAEIAPGLDIGETVDSLQQIARSMRGRFDELGILACRWDRLGSFPCAGKERGLRWHGFERLRDPNPPVPDFVQVLVSGQAERGLRFETLGHLPENLPVRTGEAIGINLCGKVQSAAGASIPISFGGIGSEPEGDATSRIDWCFRRGDHPYVAASFGQAVGALANPFDLGSLASAFNTGILLGARVEACGGFGIGGSLKINALDASLGPIGAAFDAQLGFHASRRGGFLVDLYPAPDPLNGRPAVRADIHRTRREEETTDAMIGLTLDLSRALSDLRTVLLDDERVRGAGDLLKRFEPFVPPSEYIRQRLGKALKERIESPELRVLLEGILGSSHEASAVDRLRQRLTAAMDSRADLWSAPDADLAGDVARKALEDLPLSQTGRGLLSGIARLAVENSLKSLRSGLEDEITNQVNSSSGARRLAHALDRAEAALTQGLRRTDSLAERVKVQLDRLQRVQSAIARALKNAGEVKLNARWRSLERRTEGSSIEQSLLFRPEHPAAAELFECALTGSLEDIFKRFAGGPRGNQERPVTLIAGNLQELAGVSRESGVEVALLSFQLQGFSLLDANVLIETDAAGNIRVCTKQSSRRIAGTSSQREVFEAINVFELASAKQTRRMSLSLSLSQVHEELKDREVEAFFRGLTNPRIGLLTEQQVENALAKLPPEDALRAGELRAWMELDDAQLRRFLHLPPLGAKLRHEPLPEAEARGIYERAIDAMLAGLQVPKPGADYNNLEDMLDADPKGPLTDAWIKSRIHKYQPNRGDVTIMDTDERDFERFQAIAERAHGLVRTIRSMRKIYFSEPGLDWTPEVYRGYQEQINDDIIGWVRGEFGDFLRRVAGKDVVNPYMLAYFKVVADLARAPSADHDTSPLLASIVVPSTATGGGTTEIPLVEASAPALAPLTHPHPLPRQPVPARRPPVEPDSRPTTDTHGKSELRTNAMPKLIYPLDDKNGTTTYHKGGRKFGASRGGRLHAGCDMLAQEGTRIRAMADGTVVRSPYHFYEGTYAIEIEHPQPTGGSVLIRYGEVSKGIPTNIKRNATVEQGEVIAYVGKLKQSSMLHMEMYEKGGDHSNLTGSSKYRRRRDLKDPTALLDQAPTFAQREQGGGGSDTGDRDDKQREPAEWPGIVDPTKIGVALNVRKKPRIISGEDPVRTLLPDTQIKVLGAETGGAHPFGSSNLWHRIRIRPDKETHYVIAHFIKTNMPMLGVSPMAGLPTTGHVTAVQTNLNIRSDPSVNANLLCKLSLGTEVQIIRQCTGDEYCPGRNDWVEIRVIGDAAQNRGFAAAFYISPGEKADPPCDDDMGEWTQVLIEHDWPGRKSGGRAECERLARFDVDIVRRLAPIFQGVANKFGVPAFLLAAIASRESGCGRLLDDNGWGDRGNAFGIMQVDKRYHTIHNRSAPAGHEHVEQAAGIFCGFLDGVRQKKTGWSKKSQLHGATAAYNFGLKNVQNEDSIDVGSTQDDYGGDTLARAKFFYNHPGLRALR